MINIKFISLLLLLTQFAHATNLNGTANQVQMVPAAGGLAKFRNTGSPSELINLSLKYAIGSSALTATITQADGSTVPTTTNPATYFVRSTTATLGSFTRNEVTTTKTVVISSGTTLGLTSSINSFLYFYGATGGVLLASPALFDENTLQSYVQESGALTSITNASPGVLTFTGHGLNNGDAITLTTSGGLPTGLTASTVYYVVSTAANTFSLAATPGGTAINTSSAGSGTHTYHIAGSRLVCTTGTTAATNQGIKLLGRMQFNITAGTWAAPAEVSPVSVKPRIIPVPKQYLTAGSYTYITPPGASYLEVWVTGGGGGGSSTGHSTAAGGNGVTGNTSSFGSVVSCTGGNPGTLNSPNGGVGGTGGSCTINSPAIPILTVAGGSGSGGMYNASSASVGPVGAIGGVNPMGGTGATTTGAATVGATGTGSGGAGPGASGLALGETAGSSGGAGGFSYSMIPNPGTSYTVVVGDQAAGGTNSGDTAGGVGASGSVIVRAY